MDTWVEVQQTAHEVPISGSFTTDGVSITGTKNPYVGDDEPVNYANPVDGRVYSFYGGSYEYGRPIQTYYVNEKDVFHSVDGQYSSVDTNYDGVTFFVTGQIVGTQESEDNPGTNDISKVAISSGVQTEVRGGVTSTAAIPGKTFEYLSTVWFDGGPANPQSQDSGLPASAQRLVQSASDAGLSQTSHPVTDNRSFVEGDIDEFDSAVDDLASLPDIQEISTEATYQKTPVKFISQKVSESIKNFATGAGAIESLTLIEAPVLALGLPQVLAATIVFGAALHEYDVLSGKHTFDNFKTYLSQ